MKKNNGKLVTKILDMSRAWKGGSSAEYKQHLVDIQALMAKVPQQLRNTCDDNLVINLIIENLAEDPKLEAVHTVIRSKHNDDPAKVTFAYIEREVTSILADKEKSKASKATAEISQEDPIASVATFFTQKKRFQPRGKFTSNQTRSPISKPTGGNYRIPKSAWQAMSEDERQKALKVMRAFNESRNSTSNSRGRGGRGRGNSTSQRQKSDKSEAEAEFADIASGGVSCFNAEITRKMSDLSACDDDGDEDLEDRPAPTVLFTVADDSQPTPDNHSSQK